MYPKQFLILNLCVSTFEMQESSFKYHVKNVNLPLLSDSIVQVCI